MAGFCNVLRRILSIMSDLIENMGCTSEERSLVEACLRGERSAQKRLYDIYAQRMMPICIRYTNDRDSALDLLHDGFVKVFAHLEDFKFEGSFDGWMRRIFVNTALGQVRKVAEQPYMVDVEEAYGLSQNDYSVLDEMSAEEILQCVARLPDVYRTVFNMYVMDDYSHKEIAEKLNVTEPSSRVYFLRARKLLQEMLEKKGR